MKILPIRIAIFILVVLGILFGLMFLSSRNGIKKSQTQEDGFVYQDFSLKYPSYKTFLELDKDSTLTREDILKVTQSVTPVEEETTETVIEEVVDSIPDQIKKLDFTKMDTTQLVRIRYPDSNPDFIPDLQKRLKKKRCRILHYGDSQLEGDRITAYLRNRLQNMYGGSGPGFLPVKPVYNQVSAVVEPSDNWLRFAMFDPTQDKIPGKKYGTYMSVSRFTPYPDTEIDSIRLDSMKSVKASVIIGKSSKTYAKFRRFNNIGLHYGSCMYPVQVSVYDNEKLIQRDSLKTDGGYHRYAIRTKTTPDNLRIEFEGKISPDFYGLTLDSYSGIQIDNVAMRGSSGTIFASTSNTTYSRMTRNLDPEVIIMQYGGNTIPYLKDSTEVDNYAKYVVSQVKWIKRRTGDVQFIFIGPTDMCIPVNGKMQTYPLLPYLNEKLMSSCLQNDIAYWSMYDAMGGKGSMEFWVEEKLAGLDYTHFTRKGTKIISELFFTALYLDLIKESPENEVL